VGDRITLAVDGRPFTGTVVGIAEELGAAGVAYVPETTLEAALGRPGAARSLRVVFAPGDAQEQGRTQRAVEEALARTGASVSLVISDRELRAAVGGHFAILVAALIFMAALMGTVGVLGLASTMSTSVLERIREFGVMRAIGGTPRVVVRNILFEGVFIGGLSWVFAVMLSLPLSHLVGRVAGTLAFRLPLPLMLSPLGLFLWLAIALLGAGLASLLPALRASRLSIREALAYS